MRRRADRIDRITRMLEGSPSVSPCLRVSYHKLTPEEREIVKGKWKVRNEHGRSLNNS